MRGPKSRALALGGGGVAGIAWETGVLFGLAEQGVDVRDADVILGTSAGSAVAAQITSGTSLAELYDRHASPTGESTELPVEFDLEKMVADWTGLLEATSPGAELRAAIGRYALAAPTVPERRRRAVIEARLPSHEWPDGDVRIVAVDAGTGEERVFTSADGANLVDVVAASCAVPGIWPPVNIDGRRYIDGGVRSSTSVDLLADEDVVLVLAPVEDLTVLDPAVDKASQKVLKRKKTLVIRPDEDSLAAFGANPLDPASARPSAQAGRAQATAIADDVRTLWQG
jgi:NTE family protein